MMNPATDFLPNRNLNAIHTRRLNVKASSYISSKDCQESKVHDLATVDGRMPRWGAS